MAAGLGVLYDAAGQAHIAGPLTLLTPTLVAPNVRFRSVKRSDGEIGRVVAQAEDGRLFGWTWNYLGDRCDFTEPMPGFDWSNTFPHELSSVTNWTDYAVGDGDVLAVKGGQLFAWGTNGSGVHGDGSRTRWCTPASVGTNTNWTNVSVSSTHVAATRSDGTLWTWGSNQFGQLGDGTTIDHLVPTQVGQGVRWLSADVGTRNIGLYFGIGYSTMAIEDPD